MHRVIAVLAGLVLIAVAVGLALTVPVLAASGGCSPAPCQAGGPTTLDVIGAVLAGLGAILASIGAVRLLR